MYEASSVRQGESSIGARLFRAIHALRHLAVNLPLPIRICLFGRDPERDPLSTSPGVMETQRLVRAAFVRVGADDVSFIDGRESDLSSFELLISRRISEALEHRYDHFSGREAAESATALLDDLSDDRLPPGAVRVVIEREAGLSLAAYASEYRHLPPVVLVLPCGMPLDLCLGWFNVLSQHFFVVTWETRCLFGACEAFDSVRFDSASQVEDLFAVMDHFRLEHAQAMGICGGAVIALCAAIERSERIRALSLWYGDYNLGLNDLRTNHQKNFEWLMETAAENRQAARELQGMFTDPSALANVPAEIAHAALYPYVNDELMFRYARLNDALNKTDVKPYLGQVSLPTLVVTGDSDDTTHCGGSIFVAEAIPRAQLHVELGGSHPAFFGIPTASVALAVEFFVANLERANT
jgi:3-oxoadipate enol-lactonase